MHEIQVDELVRATSRLGALPISLIRLAAVTGAPEFDFGEVVEVVGHDMVLASGVLRTANSAASGSLVRVDNVHDAVVRLGAARTLAAAMLTIVGSRFQQPLHAYELDPGALWRHSCAASIAADLTRTSATVRLPASTGTTGLLHDIGKLVLDAVLSERAETFTFGEECGGALCDVEREAFGIDHAEAGAVVAAFWELPPAIVEGIRAHHSAGEDPVAVSIALADTIAHGAVDPTMLDELRVLRLARVIGIPRDGVRQLVETSAQRLELLADHYRADPS